MTGSGRVTAECVVYDRLRSSHSRVCGLSQAQVEAQKSAANFQHANGLYRAAKETVALAEERLMNSDDGGKVVLDAAWQDMLNHATAKVCYFPFTFYRLSLKCTTMTTAFLPAMP